MSGGRVTATPFAMVPEWLLDSEVSDRAVRLYAMLRRYADSAGRAYPSRRRLGERLGCSEKSVDRTIGELVECGVLVVTPRFSDRGDRAANDYRLVDERTPVSPGGVTGGPTPLVTGGPTPLDTGDEGKEESQFFNESHTQRETTASQWPDTDSSVPTSETASEVEVWGSTTNAKTARATMARAMVTDWWDERKAAGDPPAQPFMAVVKVVERVLANGVAAAAVAWALRNVPTVSAGAIEMALSRRAGRGQARSSTTATALRMIRDGR